MVYSGQTVQRQDIQGFIPNVWTGDIRYARSTKFMMKNVLQVRSFIGKKGDTYFEPLVGRAAVYDKLAGQPVQLQSRKPGEWRMVIDRYKESSFAIEDIAEIQSQYNLRTPYTKEAGYALGRDLDNYALSLRAAIPTTQQIFRTIGAGAGTAAGTPAPIDSNSILTAKTFLEEKEVDVSDMVLVVTPGQYNDLLDIDKFVSSDYVDGRPVVTGFIGTLYGIPVMSNNNMKINSLDGYRNGQGAPGQPTPGVIGSPYLPSQDAIVGNGLPRGQTGQETTNPFVSCLLCSKEWAMMAIQKNIGAEYSRENMLQSDVVVMTHVYAGKVRRAEEAILIHTAP